MTEKEVKRFGMSWGSPMINHLVFVDDMIILYKDKVRTLQMVATTMEQYEQLSRHKINKEKNIIYFHYCVSDGEMIMAEVET